MIEEKLKKYRINQKEYEKIKELLGREPQGVEWALFSALWSEHCSYKSSKVHLKGLFNQSPRVLQSFGENAGVIDLGQGERVAFKMESHNHPSFIEPYQGAATGVGGILRDVFTMGARPIALANYLCFGEPKSKRMSQLIEGVVGGISGYGNCVGVPNITGQTEFHSSYNNNILVNAFALGLFRPGDKVFLSQAQGVGNLVVYVGAKTGRDGVHGASMASESFDENSESKRPTVQIGDPFFEKLLIESCLEVMKENLVVAIQDMGAAGLTSSSFEMAAKGGVGFDIDLKKVPLRDSSLTPEDILLSESQERMLLICKPEQLQALQKVFAKWHLDAVAIGEVTSSKKVKLCWGNEVLTEIDPGWLVDNAPVYHRDFSPWKSKNQVGCDGDIHLEVKSSQEFLVQALQSPQGASRGWIFHQYDQRVGARTARDCSNDIGIVRLPDSGRWLSVVVGCRPTVMRTDAVLGGADSVALPALELASKGFESVGVTDCLNFGNPEKNPIMSEFVASVRAMSSQCEALGAPIISGNVSFYNETENQNITSTPATGLVGISEGTHLPHDQFVQPDEDVYVLSLNMAALSGESGALMNGAAQFWGAIDTQKVAELTKGLKSLVSSLKPATTRVVGKFGVAYTLARMVTEKSGFQYEDGYKKLMPANRDQFIERLYEVILTVPRSQDAQKLIRNHFSNLELGIYKIGKTGGQSLKLPGIEMTVQEIKNVYESGWRKHFEKLS